ncbi:MAG TPA: NEW3 domain-containing protein [Bryobacteraceae bacterium]|jgi:M6 family metalloprotease-like protein
MCRLKSITALLFITIAGGLHAQPAGEVSERVRSLNGSLLRLHGDTHGASPSQLAELRRQAHATIQQRAAALESLIQNDPDSALKLGFSSELISELKSRFPQSAELLESYGEWEGPATYWVLDDASLRSSKNTIKMSAGEETLEVHYAGEAPAGLTCGTILHVSGMRVNNHVAPMDSRLSHTDSIAKPGGAMATPPCTGTGVENIAVILVTFPGVAPPITASQAYNVFFGTGNRSLNGYWQDASHGLTSATGNVFGWYTLPQAYTCDQYTQIGTAGMQAASSDVNFAAYNRIVYVFPLPSGCSYGGVSTVGCVMQTFNGQTFAASNHWLVANYLSPNDTGVELAVHEVGHGLTLNHARSRGFSSMALGALGVNGTITEYGDNFDPMGYYNLGHYDAQHKVQLGWLTPSNVQNVSTSGSYTIGPYGTATAGPVALQVQRGTGNSDYLWIEYHQPTGNYESTLSSAIFGGATIRYLDSLTGSGYTDLLNFSPQLNSWLNPVLPTGQSWTDPYSNVSVTVNSATPSAMNVSVTYGAAACAPGTPGVTVSPSNPSVASGSSVNYTVTVTNTDSTGCGTGTFSLSSAQPTNWSSSLSSTALNIAPGQSASVTLSKTVPTGTTPGTYAVPVSVTKATVTSNQTANCSVMAPPPPLSATVSVGTATGNGKNVNVPISASVLSGTLPAAGATVVFTLTAPKGSTTTQTVSTNSSGVASWSYKAGTAGSYTVTAKATLGSQTVTSSTVGFSVQ